jgi:hypothetical protein
MLALAMEFSRTVERRAPRRPVGSDATDGSVGDDALRGRDETPPTVACGRV